MARSVSVVNISIDLHAVRALGACAGRDAQRARQAVYLRLAVQRAGHFSGLSAEGVESIRAVSFAASVRLLRSVQYVMMGGYFNDFDLDWGLVWLYMDGLIWWARVTIIIWAYVGACGYMGFPYAGLCD